MRRRISQSSQRHANRPSSAATDAVADDWDEEHGEGAALSNSDDEDATDVAEKTAAVDEVAADNDIVGSAATASESVVAVVDNEIEIDSVAADAASSSTVVCVANRHCESSSPGMLLLQLLLLLLVLLLLLLLLHSGEQGGKLGEGGLRCSW